jgi:electron transfer flavoprotein alpha subunit
VRPLYAGNAIATVKTAEPTKILSIRGTAFDKAPAEGGSAASEAAPTVADVDAGQYGHRHTPFYLD